VERCEQLHPAGTLTLEESYETHTLRVLEHLLNHPCGIHLWGEMENSRTYTNDILRATKRNGTEHNATQRNTTQHNATQRNTTEGKGTETSWHGIAWRGMALHGKHIERADESESIRTTRTI